MQEDDRPGVGMFLGIESKGCPRPLQEDDRQEVPFTVGCGSLEVGTVEPTRREPVRGCQFYAPAPA